MVTAEVLRNDMGSASEKLASITLDGVQMLPRGGCNPPGSDYSCDFWTCPVVSAAQVVSKTGSIAVTFDVRETSWDCDCDTKTWQCSAENRVAGRTAMEAAVRFTLTPTTTGRNSPMITQAPRPLPGTATACVSGDPCGPYACT